MTPVDVFATIRPEKARSETGIGGVKTYRTLEGGTRPESCPRKAWTFDPRIEDFHQNICRKGSISGAPPKIRNFHHPSYFFWRFDPPPPPMIPVSNKKRLDRQSSASLAQGRCKGGRSEIPHVCSKLQSFALEISSRRMRETRRTTKNEEKRRTAKNNEENRKINKKQRGTNKEQKRRKFIAVHKAALRPKMSAKFPPNFPQDFPCKKTKKSPPTSFCRCAWRAHCCSTHMQVRLESSSPRFETFKRVKSSMRSMARLQTNSFS